MNIEFPIKITVGNKKHDAYIDVYDAIEKYLYDENGCMIASDYYVTLEMGSNRLDTWLTTRLEYDSDYDEFVWATDWWEGENIIVIHGIAEVKSLHFYGVHKDEDIK